MGLIFFAVWAAGLLLLGAPGAILAVLLGRGSRRGPTFWCTAVTTAVIALAARVLHVMAPRIDAGAIDVWPTQFALIVSWLLVGSLLASGAFVVALRREPARGSAHRDLALGIGAGLAASVLLQLFVPWYLRDLAAVLELPLQH